MSKTAITRRGFLFAGGLTVGGFAVPGWMRELHERTAWLVPKRHVQVCDPQLRRIGSTDITFNLPDAEGVIFDPDFASMPLADAVRDHGDLVGRPDWRVVRVDNRWELINTGYSYAG